MTKVERRGKGGLGERSNGQKKQGASGRKKKGLNQQQKILRIKKVEGFRTLANP